MKLLRRIKFVVLFIILFIFISGCENVVESEAFEDSSLAITKTQVLSVFEQYDIRIEENTDIISEDYMMGGIEPSVYNFYPMSLKDSNLFLYIFDSEVDRINWSNSSIWEWAANEGNIESICIKNVCIIISLNSDGEEIEHAQWLNFTAYTDKIKEILLSEIIK